MEGIIAEVRELKDCLKAGYYERAYELAQNVDDELTTFEIKIASQMTSQIERKSLYE